eukprot:3405728-Prymnesium_polylepis.1
MEYAPPAPPVVDFRPSSSAALEAAWRLQSNRAAIAGFLLRKQREAARVAAGVLEAAPAKHWKAAGRRRPLQGAWSADAPPGTTELADAQAAAANSIDTALLGLASTLAGLCTPAEAVALLGGREALAVNPVAGLGELVGTPRDMSSAAAAQLRAAIREMGS